MDDLPNHFLIVSRIYVFLIWTVEILSDFYSVYSLNQIKSSDKRSNSETNNSTLNLVNNICRNEYV